MEWQCLWWLSSCFITERLAVGIQLWPVHMVIETLEQDISPTLPVQWCRLTVTATSWRVNEQCHCSACQACEAQYNWVEVPKGTCPFRLYTPDGGMICPCPYVWLTLLNRGVQTFFTVGRILKYIQRQKPQTGSHWSETFNWVHIAEV